MHEDLRHLVILTPGFPKNEEDDTCIPFQQSLLLQLRKSYPQLKVTVIAFQYPYHSQTYDWHGFQAIPFNGRNRGGLRRLWLRKKILRKLGELQAKERINGLLSFWYNECAATGEIFSRKYSVNHYCWLWGQDARAQNKYPGRIHIPSNRIIALSDFLQEEFEKNHVVKPAWVIPPGIERNRISMIQEEKKTDILAVGSLIPLKRYDLYLELLAEIKKKVPTLKAILIGDGPDRHKLERLKNELGLDDTLIMTGELSHELVLQKMRECRIFLHTSSYEGFVMACLEAVYSGARVFSFVQPMKRPIDNWTVVNTKEEMIENSIQALNNYQVPGAVDPFPLENTVMKIMDLLTH